MNLISYTEALQAIGKGEKVTAKRWDCKYVRLPQLSDHDFLNADSLEGLIIEDCDRKVCDCRVGVWAQQPEDKLAEDYYVIE